MEDSKTRIHALDGLRCIAIMAVIAYHYGARWTSPMADNLYPYRDFWAAVTKYGGWGVELFFVISGFVITLTLARCETLREFAVRRIARLWPTLILCSALTFILVLLIPDSPFTPALANFVPSLTLILPATWEWLMPSVHFNWMDGVYWSLVVEVRFYVLISLLYFFDRRNFDRNICRAASAIIGLYTVALLIGNPLLVKVIKAALIPQFMPWFLMGIGFYFRSLAKPYGACFLIAWIGLLSQMIAGPESHIIAINALLIPALVCVCMHSTIFSRRWITDIGTASYSLYLLHQQIGVALIHWVKFTGVWTSVFALLTTAGMIASAKVIYRYWEIPWNTRIVATFIKNRTHGSFNRPLQTSPE